MGFILPHGAGNKARLNHAPQPFQGKKNGNANGGDHQQPPKRRDIMAHGHIRDTLNKI